LKAVKGLGAKHNQRERQFDMFPFSFRPAITISSLESSFLYFIIDSIRPRQEKVYDTKSDIWWLVYLIYELAATKPPFHEAKTHNELSILIRYV
jgi:hypothetical protein